MHRWPQLSVATIVLFCALPLASPGPVFAQRVGNSGLGESSPLLSRTSSEAAHPVASPPEDLVMSSGASGLSDSRIGPDDLLNITVFEAPEMNATLRVSANGDISMQLLGRC